jgi:3-oxoacyl-[acyl-carrier-protein] synthase-3
MTVSSSVLGLGAWLPEAVRANDAWPASFAEAHATRVADFVGVTATSAEDLCDRITMCRQLAEKDDPFLGAKRRRVAPPEARSWEVEAIAARAALKEARVEPRDVGAVLSFAAVPDRITPPTAAAVAKLVGADRAFAIATDAVCASSLVQLELASALVESGRARFVLLTQSHLMTRAFPMSHPVAPSVGDAASAIVVGASSSRGVHAVFARTDGAYFDAVAWRRPRDADAAWWEPGGAFAMGSYDSDAARRLVQDTVRVGAETCRAALDAAGVVVDRVGALACIQPRRWIPGAIAEALGLEGRRAPQTFDDFAHLGACGVVVNLLEARRAGLVDDRPALLYAQGAGFTRAAAVIDCPRAC